MHRGISLLQCLYHTSTHSNDKTVLARAPSSVDNDGSGGNMSICICFAKATVSPDRTISGSFDWLRLGQGATDRQCLLRYPAAVAYRDRSLRVVALSRTIGVYQWQEPS